MTPVNVNAEREKDSSLWWIEKGYNHTQPDEVSKYL